MEETKITFKLINDQTIQILKNGEVVGKIFSPSGSGSNNANAIQICGFSEAFDYWGCANFPGFKDIQLLFDGKALAGESTDFSLHNCVRCYRYPCQCENRIDTVINKVTIISNANPFDLKREGQLESRLIFRNESLKRIEKYLIEKGDLDGED